MKESTKWITFLAIILSLGIGGFLFGLRRGKSELYASAGMIFGFLICLVIWLVQRKESYRNPLTDQDVVE